MREQVLSNAVIKGTTVSGKFAANEYDVCGLMKLSLESIDSLYKSNKELLDKSKTDSLLKRTKSTKFIEEKIQLLQTVFDIKTEMLEADRLAANNYQERKNKLVLLSKAKERKEILAIENLSLEEIEKQLAELEF